jgi:hypothetical protein
MRKKAAALKAPGCGANSLTAKVAARRIEDYDNLEVE